MPDNSELAKSLGEIPLGNQGDTPQPSPPSNPSIGKGNNKPTDPSFDDGLDEIDSLESELNNLDANKEDDFSRDLGWGDNDEDKEPEVEPEEEEEEDEGQGDPENPDEEDAPVEDEEPKEGDDSEKDPEPEEEEEPEEEAIYKADRDYPDWDIDKTEYKTRQDLNNGLAQKRSYIRSLREDLKNHESDFGALDLPSSWDENPDTADEPASYEQIASLDDDTAKKEVAEHDRLIRQTKQKLNRVKEQYQEQSRENKMDKEFESEASKFATALQQFEINPQDVADKRVNWNQIENKVEERLKAMKEGEDGDEYAEQYGRDAWRQKINELEKEKNTIDNFPAKAQKYEDQKNSKEKANQPPSREQMRQTFSEFKADNPNLPIFKNQDAEAAFAEDIKFRVRNNMDTAPKTARDWKRLYKDWNSRINSEVAKSKQESKAKAEKKKNEKEQEGNTVKKKKSNNIDNQLRADKSNKQRPPAHEIKSSKYSDGISRTTAKDIDAELDMDASELDNEFTIKGGGI